MKKKEKMLPKVLAIIALLAIISGIIGTGILIVFESFFAQSSQPEITQQQLQEYIDTLSGATLQQDSSSGSQDTGTGS